MVIRIRLPALARAWRRTRAPVAHAPIIGFDAAARAWITESGKATACTPLPSLRGRLLADIAAQMRAFDGQDLPTRRLVAAMLLPGEVEDIVRMMRFCDELGIVVASTHASASNAAGPIVRIHADALGHHRPMLRVVAGD